VDARGKSAADDDYREARRNSAHERGLAVGPEIKLYLVEQRHHDCPASNAE
jgi:hypothetical protein